MAAAAIAAVPNNPNDPVLSADSDFVRALYAQPASHLEAVLVAREAATIASDKVAAERLDAHAEGIALAKLAGQPAPVVASIRDVAEGRAPSLDRQALRARLLAATLRAKLAHRPDGYALYPARDPMMFLDYRYEGSSVWSSHQRNGGLPEWVHLRVEIENAGTNEVSQFDARLSVPLADGKAAVLDCRPQPWFDRLAPGGSAQHVCSSQARYIDAARLVAAVQAVEKDPSSWKLAPSRINFADPPISLNSHGVFFLKGSAARQEIVTKLKAASCFEKNSCFDEIAFRMKFNPAWALGVPALALGLILGFVFRLFPRYQWRAAKVASGLSVGAFVVAVGATAAGGGMGLFAAMIVANVGAIALAVFNGALWVTLALLNAFRGARAEAAP